MQVANALNNNIRILFNPRVEAFKLFDFLMVKSDQDKYIAQIIEIYDDKFDASQNVAKLKLFYKITSNNEVMPYDNFTPNKECEIVKIKQEEIERFINQDKKTFIFATNAKTSCSLEIQYDFFNNNSIILSDKIENANAISLNLAKNLSKEKHAIVIDSTGVVEFDEAKKIKASKHFRLPLNYTTIDFIFDKCLSDASLEFQAIGGEIINEIKKFARKQEQGFIPFNAFTRVLLEQYRVTPYPELKLLLSRIKKYQMDEIFARTKKDKETLFKTIGKNPITILDFSSIDASWQKAYLEYIINEIEQDVYLIVRINDENFDVSLINKIYSEKKNIKFIPNVSYNYKKLPSIMQYCKNYLLMPSLYQRTDFLDANFALCNLISDGCILFGENTDNFLYLAKDYELEVQEKRKNYRKIALSLLDEDNEVKQEDKTDSQKLMDELSNFEAQQLEKQETEQEQELKQEIEDNFKKELIDEQDEFPDLENKNSKPEIEETKDEFQNITDEKEQIQEPLEEEPVEDIKKEPLEELVEEPSEEPNSDDLNQIEPIELDAVENIEIKEQQPQEEKPKINVADVELVEFDEGVQINPASQENKFKLPEHEYTIERESLEEESINFSDEELDFFQIAKESQENAGIENVVIDEVQYKTHSDEEGLDLNEVANNSIDNSFEDIINTKNEESKQTLSIDENTTIDIDETSIQEKENLPIFKEEQTQSKQTYKTGDVINHKKYGKGTITKTIKYEQRQLLQIQFANSGKKLLDPKVADIELIEQ